MPEIVAELNAKIPVEPKTINLHTDGFGICFYYDSFSSESIMTMSHGVSKINGFGYAIEIERWQEGLHLL